ncbi:DUF6538 domain-containing protein [Sulfitobacter faviae]|uniref:DUF6538 domain-containing protein n=1 Tax=Sulfitobacter faviae TaxID=1775881 RepID=A0ABZ0V0I7_9RHOB|nr:DUF6538 domain-containing protein [Sulfitobacter faviae]WPZ22371.1 DUF6538 domain-containing protein [Sulfitobacter faviae]
MAARYKVMKRSGTHNWQLRYYVPSEEQRRVGKAEIWRSLRTPDKRIAEERALDVVKELIAEVRGTVTTSPVLESEGFEPTHEEIKEAVRQVYEAEVEADLEERADPEHVALFGMGGKASSRANRAEAKRLRKAAARGDFRVADIEFWLGHFGFDLPEGSPKRAAFHQGLAFAYAEAAERWAEHDLGRIGRKPSIPDLRRPKHSGRVTV